MDSHDILDDTLRSHFRILFWPPRAARRSARTKELYEYDLNTFDRFLGRDAVISDLADDTIERFLAWRIGGGARIPTANRSRDVLMAVWRFLASKGLVTRWPTSLPLVEPERAPIAWTREQLQRLWAACESQEGMICGVPAGLWWHALHAILWDTGERIGAVIQSKWNDVDLDSRWILFRAETRKGRRKDQLSQLHPHTSELLRKMPRQSPLLFPWPMSRGMIWYRYHVIRKAAGLPVGRNHAFHCVRRSVASYVELAGGNPTSVLGHSSPKTTQRHYLDPRICPPTQASSILFRPTG